MVRKQEINLIKKSSNCQEVEIMVSTFLTEEPGNVKFEM